MAEKNRDKNKESEQVREYEGSSAEEAIKQALADLKLPRERIKIQILTEGTHGLFGMEGAKAAKIRVTILPPAAENDPD